MNNNSNISENNSADKSFDELLDDYATERVPDNISVSGLRISMITTAVTFSLPGLVTGLTIATSLEFKSAVLAFVIGGLVLATLGFITGIVGVRNRLSSYMLIRMAFGELGSKAVNLCIAMSLFGWFGVNVYLFGDAGSGLWSQLELTESTPTPFILFGGLLMTLVAII